MEKIIPYVVLVVIAIVIALLLKFIWKVGGKKIFAFIGNVIAGFVILYLINLIPGVSIPINVFYSIVIGIAGIAGVIFIVIYEFLIK